MPWLFLFSIIVAIAAVILALRWRAARRSGSKNLNGGELQKPFKYATFVVGTIALALFVGSCFKIVGTKEVGVVTSFGKPVGAVSNGPHFTKPWEKKTNYDGAIQINRHDVDGDDDDRIKVRLMMQTTAHVNASVSWRIIQKEATSLHRDYRDFDKVRENLVTRQIISVFTEVFASYDPLSTVNAQKQPSPALVLPKYARDIQGILKQRIGTQIEVLSVTISTVDFDKDTQTRINQYQAELANTRIAEQRKLTAAAEAEANRILAGSVFKDPNALISKCLDIWARVGGSIPPYCFPGGNGMIAATK